MLLHNVCFYVRILHSGFHSKMLRVCVCVYFCDDHSDSFKVCDSYKNVLVKDTLKPFLI